MGMMKRSRVEELPYSCRTAGVAGGGGNISGGATSVSVPVTVPAGHHRILSQHAIQYIQNTSPVTGQTVLKNVDNIVAVSAAGTVQSQTVPVQYTGEFVTWIVRWRMT